MTEINLTDKKHSELNFGDIEDFGENNIELFFWDKQSPKGKSIGTSIVMTEKAFAAMVRYYISMRI